MLATRLQVRLLLFSCVLAFASIEQAQFVQISPSGSGGRTSNISRPPALLPNGNVFIINGYDAAELYDYRTRTFSHAGSLPVRISRAAAVLGLPDGRVVVTGGYDPESRPRNYVLIWNPATREFRQVAGMLSARAGHVMLVLEPDTLLIVGGEGVGTWETYDVRREKSLASGYLPSDGAFSGTLLRHPSGKIIFLGGSRATVLDPGTLTFTVGFGIPAGFFNAAVEMLSDGRILVCGGTTAGGPAVQGSSLASIFDPLTGQQESVGSMLNSRFWHAATRLRSGEVLVSGGSDYCVGWCKPVVAPAEIFDPVTKRFSAIESMKDPRLHHVPLALLNGELLFVGGDNGTINSPSPELYVGERLVSKRRAVAHR